MLPIVWLPEKMGRMSLKMFLCKMLESEGFYNVFHTFRILQIIIENKLLQLFENVKKYNIDYDKNNS